MKGISRSFYGEVSGAASEMVRKLLRQSWRSACIMPDAHANQVRSLSKLNRLALAALILGTTMSALWFIGARYSERSRVEANFRRDAEHRISALNQALKGRLKDASTLALFCGANDAVDPNGFSQMAAHMMEDQPCLQAFAWIPRITLDKREQFERAARDGNSQESAARCAFSQFQIVERTPTRQTIRATAREEYYPIYYVEPCAGNEAMVGLDFASEDIRRAAITRALGTRQIVATSYVDSLEEHGQQSSFLVLAPVFGHGPESGKPTSASEHSLLGFVLAVFRLREFVESSLQHLKPAGLDMLLVDQSGPESERYSFTHWSRLRGTTNGEVDTLARSRHGPLWQEATIPVADRKWLVVFRPAPGFVSAQTTWIPEAALGGGLLLTILISSYLATSARRASQMARTNQRLLMEISERKRAEETLRDSEQRYRLFFESNPHPMWVYDLESLGFLQVNESAIHHYGYSRDEFLSMTIKDIRPPEDVPGLLESIRRGTTGLERSGTWRHRKKDGTILVVEITSHLFETGGRQAKLVLANDVTQRMKTEAALRRSEEHFRSLIENVSDLVCVLDAKGVVEYVSPSVERLLGYKPTELVGTSSFVILEPSDIPRARAAITAALDNPGVTHPATELRARRKDGVCRHMAAIGVCPETQSGPKTLVLTLHDITERKRAEEALAESEDRYRRLFDLTPDAIFIGCEDRVAFINPAGLKLFGAHDPYQIIGKPVLELVHPDWRGVVSKRIPIVLHSTESLPTIQEQFLRLDGNPVDVEVAVAHFVFDEKPAGLVIARDITERKKLEDQVRKLSRAVEQAPASILITDLAGLIEYVNPNFCQLTGYTLPELVGQNPRILKSGQTPPETYEHMWSTLHAGNEWRGELCNRKKNGEIFWEFAVISPLRSETTTTHFVAVKQDITDRKLAEEAVRSSRDNLSGIFNNVNVAIFIHNADGKVLAVNHKTLELFQVEREQALKLSISDNYSDPSNPLNNLPSLWRTVLAGETHSMEWTARRPLDGSVFPTEIFLRKITWDGQDAVMAAVYDLTEKKSLERQILRAQRVESLGTLAAGIAHDLNNILAPIMMSAHILRHNKPSEEIAEVLNNIEVSAQRGADVVKQVLTFARGVEGQRIPLQPKHIIKEIRAIVEETFPKNITFHSNVPKDLWTVAGDATQLHQVLLNLSVNARDAMPEGGSLSISAENVRVAKAKSSLFADGKAGPHVLIQVSDTGSGIPPAILEKIFDPFFTTKEQGKGTGLGLSTVLGIVRSHGGFVDVQTELGHGSTFKVYLPAKPGAAAPPPDTERRAPPRGSGECILVVDDEVNLRSVTERMLTQHGYQVLLAANGKEALEVLERHRSEVKAVVTDIMMPVMDGVALVSAIKHSNPQMPVIACTGWSQEGIQAELKGLGVECFLEKPYPSQALLTTLHQHLISTS